MKKSPQRRRVSFGLVMLIAATVSAAALAVVMRTQRLQGRGHGNS